MNQKRIDFVEAFLGDDPRTRLNILASGKAAGYGRSGNIRNLFKVKDVAREINKRLRDMGANKFAMIAELTEIAYRRPDATAGQKLKALERLHGLLSEVPVVSPKSAEPESEPEPESKPEPRRMDLSKYLGSGPAPGLGVSKRDGGNGSQG